MNSTAFLVVILVITGWSGTVFYRRARATLRGVSAEAQEPEFVVGFMLLLAAMFVSEASVDGDRELELLGYATYAEVTEKSLSITPVDWNGLDEDPQASSEVAQVRGAQLRNMNLRFARANGAILVNADLRSADLYKSDLRRADLRGANLEDAILRGADLHGTKIDDRTVLPEYGTLVWSLVNKRAEDRVPTQDLRTSRGAAHENLSGKDLAQANLTNADLKHVRLVEANLAEAILVGANLFRAGLRKARLQGADLTGTNLREAEMHEADLTGSKLDGASLDGARLTGANLTNARVYDASLISTDLTGASLDGARLEGTDLQRTTGLTQAQLRLACGNAETKLPDALVILRRCPVE